MNVQEAYNHWAETYDADENATRDLDGLVLRRVLGGQRFASVIEAGCGTGKNTAFLSQISNAVHALDFSEGMIAKAREKHQALPGVTFSIADITQRWPCPDHSAELATCNLVLEHVEILEAVFAQAARVLVARGIFLVCELHPFRQYAGGVANFSCGDQNTKIPAYTHHLSDFFQAGKKCGFTLRNFQEWWHDKDTGKSPRLVSFVFERSPEESPA